jgi:hypothetical protein
VARIGKAAGTFSPRGRHRLGFLIALGFSSSLGGCGGLEILTALPLLFPPRVSDERPEGRDLVGGPTGTISVTARTAPRKRESIGVRRGGNSPKHNDVVIETADNPFPLGPSAELPNKAQGSVAKDCICVNLACRHSIEICGQFWPPQYDWSLGGPVSYPSSFREVFVPPTGY